MDTNIIFSPAIPKLMSVFRLLVKPGKFRMPCIHCPNLEYFYPVYSGLKRQMKHFSEKCGLSDTMAAAAFASHSGLDYTSNFPFGRQKLTAGKRTRRGALQQQRVCGAEAAFAAAPGEERRCPTALTSAHSTTPAWPTYTCRSPMFSPISLLIWKKPKNLSWPIG